MTTPEGTMAPDGMTTLEGTMAPMAHHQKEQWLLMAYQKEQWLPDGNDQCLEGTMAPDGN